MSNTPAENIARLAKIKAEVVGHHMCARFAEEGGCFRVAYPLRSHPVFDGVNVHIGDGSKAKALQVVLDKMNLHYEEGRLK